MGCCRAGNCLVLMLQLEYGGTACKLESDACVWAEGLKMSVLVALGGWVAVPHPCCLQMYGHSEVPDCRLEADAMVADLMVHSE
eukprot:2551065-Ditylum_brightwellii.AAC.2